MNSGCINHWRSAGQLQRECGIYVECELLGKEMVMMIREVADEYQILRAVHASIDKMLEGLSDEQWVTKPLPNFNAIAAVMDHVVRVEKRFMSAIAGEEIDTKSMEPFAVDHWDVSAIRDAWAASLPYAEQVLATVTESDLIKTGLKLGVGEMNRRQLLTYAIAHATHHRGQIPLLRKLLP